MEEQILIVDDEQQLCVSLKKLLTAQGYNAIYSLDPVKAIELLRSEDICLVITDLKMPGMSGTELIKEIRKIHKNIPIIMVSGYASVDNVVKAMRYGATNFFKKPVRFAELIKEISNLLSAEFCHNSHYDLEKTRSAQKLISTSKLMQKRINMLKKAAPTDAPVLITGESGTGKELAAEIIHTSSQRQEKPFIKFNCAAIPEALLESELFGVNKGAFTSAVQSRPGKFEIAKGGSIFLDEIGEMSTQTQAKLLRVLQENEFQRLGSHTTQKMEARIIAATNKQLQKQIKKGKFREDLFYRLSVIHIELPSLRERREDILPLSRFFLESFNNKYSKNIKGLSRETETIFIQHDWPGNVRELKNSIERMVIFCEGDFLEPELLPEQYRKYSNESNSPALKEVSNSVNREIILETLEKCNGSRSKAAEILGITRRTLYNKIKKLKIDL